MINEERAKEENKENKRTGIKREEGDETGKQKRWNEKRKT